VSRYLVHPGSALAAQPRVPGQRLPVHGLGQTTEAAGAGVAVGALGFVRVPKRGIGAEDAKAEEHGQQVGEGLLVLLLCRDPTVAQQQDMANSWAIVATNAIGRAD
jgi:hypothetical protein